MLAGGIVGVICCMKHSDMCKDSGKKTGKNGDKDGKLDGLSIWWTYENGQKWLEGTYKNGKEDGSHTRWFENGQKRSKENYKDGKLVSETCWDEDGNEKECD